MKISEMQRKQRKLDNFIAAKKNLGLPYDEKYREGTKLALLVEIGELANATRCFKNWSTKGMEPKERILDEIADVIHFVLKMMNFDEQNIDIEFMRQGIPGLADYVKSRTLIQMFNSIFYKATNEEWYSIFKNLVAICEKLGYTREEVISAYEKKLAENYKRQETGY